MGAGTTGIVQSTTLEDTDPRFVGLKILGIQKTHVVGGNHTNIELLGGTNSPSDKSLFTTAPGTSQLQEITIAKNIQPAARGGSRSLGIGVDHILP